MAKSAESKETIKIAATNRRAHSQYEILDTLEAGLVLTGPEVKSLRQGKANLQDGFARIEGTEPYLWNVHINPYTMGSAHVVQEPLRKRKLLMNRSEINRWMGKTTIKGLTIVPLEIYFNKRGVAKVKLALAKGKRGPDKREDLKKKDLRRELQRNFGDKYKLK
jgi:SsrA-binding protein